MIRRVGTAWPLVLAWMVASAPAWSAASESPITIVPEPAPEGVRLVAFNNAPYPVTVTLELTAATHVRADRALPADSTVLPGGRGFLVALTRTSLVEAWSYRYRWSWTAGSLLDDDAARTQTVMTPFPAGFRFETVGVPEGGSDTGRFVWNVDPDVPVLAAREGTVVKNDPIDEPGACRRIWVMHDDGTLAEYEPLASPAADVGGQVAAGGRLGRTTPDCSTLDTRLGLRVFGVAPGGEPRALDLAFVTSDAEPGTVDLAESHPAAADDAGAGAGTSEPVPQAEARSASSDVGLETFKKLVDGEPREPSTFFGANDVVHLHVSLPRSGARVVELHFFQDGRRKPRAIRRVQTGESWDGAKLTLDLAGIDRPYGRWQVRARVDGEEVARREFRVGIGAIP